jgi:hypothetical protein
MSLLRYNTTRPIGSCSLHLAPCGPIEKCSRKQTTSLRFQNARSVPEMRHSLRRRSIPSQCGQAQADRGASV